MPGSLGAMGGQGSPQGSPRPSAAGQVGREGEEAICWPPPQLPPGVSLGRLLLNGLPGRLGAGAHQAISRPGRVLSQAPGSCCPCEGLPTFPAPQQTGVSLVMAKSRFANS